MIDYRDRVRGCLRGIAIGDALGMPYEKVFTFEQLNAISDEQMLQYQDPPAGHPFHDGTIKAGETTDDTQLTRVVAESLIACGRIDMDDVARRHVEALETRTSGWGKGTTKAIQSIKDGISWKESGIKDGAGNGVMMKISPVGLMAAMKLEKSEAAKVLMDSVSLSFMTHASRMGIAQGLIQTMAVAMTMCWETMMPHFGCDSFEDFFLDRAISQGEVIEPEIQRPIYGDRLTDRLIDLKNAKRYNESLDALAVRYGENPFYVYDSLPLAYCCFLKNHDNFQSVVDAIRVGGDTDTNASIVGGLLGAKNGTAVFPQHLIDGLKEKDEILDLADRFYDRFAQ